MRRLLLALLFAASAPAAVTNFTLVGLSDGLMTACVGLASTDDLRVFYDESPGTTFTNRQQSHTTNGGTRCFGVSNGFDPGDVINVRLQVDTGGGYGDVDCNSVTNDFTPSEQSTTGSVTCHASGYYVVTFEADNGMTPTAPSGYPTATLPDFSSGRQITTSSTDCDDIQTQYDDLKNDTGDGNADALLVPYNLSDGCTSTLTLSGKTNTDDIVIISSRYNDERCPEPGTVTTYNYIGECTPEIWKADVGGSGAGTLITNSDSGVHFSLIYMRTPKHTENVWDEGGAVDSWGDSGSDLALNFASANNFDANPDILVVSHCTDTSLNGVYYSADWTDTDADTATLIGEAGKSAAGCYVFQDPTGSNSVTGALIQCDTSTSNCPSLNGVIIEQFYPDRRTYMVAAADSTDFYIANSTIIHGNRFAMNSGSTAPVYGAQGFGILTAPQQLYRLDNVQRFRASNLHIYGAGLWAFGTDTFRFQASDFLIENIFWFFPTEWFDADGSTSDFDHVAVTCRGYLLETKNAVEVDVGGVLMSGLPSCPASQNAPAGLVYIRNALSSGSDDGSRGSRDIYVHDSVVHDTPSGVAFEGQRWEQTASVGSAEGRFRVYNILGNQLTENNETAEDVSGVRGYLLNLIGNMTSVSMDRFTTYKNNVQGSTVQANRANVSKLQITNGVMAPENRSQGGGAFLRCESCASPNSDIVPQISNGEEGAETFYRIAQVTSATNSYFSGLSFTCGLENTGSDFSVSADGSRMTDTECATEYTSTNYTLASVTDYTSAAGTSIQSDINDMGLSENLEYSGTAGRGIDADRLRQQIGVFSPYTSRTYDIEVERNGDTGWTAYFSAPTTADTCFAKYREYNTTGEYTTATISSGARARTWAVTGLTPGTRYEWQLACEGAPDVLSGVWQPGS